MKELLLSTSITSLALPMYGRLIRATRLVVWSLLGGTESTCVRSEILVLSLSFVERFHFHSLIDVQTISSMFHVHHIELMLFSYSFHFVLHLDIETDRQVVQC